MSDRWGKIHGDLWIHDKFLTLTAEAGWLWTRALSFSIAQKTFGEISRGALIAIRGTDEAAAELVAAGLWDETENGWRLHDWDDHQQSREDAEALSRKRSEAGRKGGRPRKTVERVTSGNEQPASKKKPNENQIGFNLPSKPKADESKQKAEQEQEQEQEQEVTPPTPQRGAYPPDFEEFWCIYPKHAGKRDAFKAWKAAVKRTDRETINAGARAYADDPNREPAFTKHPATWLRADSWEDDPIPTRGVSETVKAIDSVNAYRVMQNEMAWPLELERRRA